MSGQRTARTQAILRIVLVGLAIVAGIVIVGRTQSTGTVKVIAPDGDYAEVCRLFSDAVADLGDDPDVDEFMTFYLTLDFEPLLAAAPAKLRRSIVVLRDSRAEIARKLRDGRDVHDLGTQDLPPGFLSAFDAIGAAASQQCRNGVIAPSEHDDGSASSTTTAAR